MGLIPAITTFGNGQSVMSGSTSVTVIIVTTNRRIELIKTLYALKKQNILFELIVVDNNSNDGSFETISRIWDDAVIVRLSSNLGLCAGRNAGIRKATGEIIVFLDDDASFLRNDALAVIRRKFREDKRIGIVATNSYLEFTRKPERQSIPRRDKKIFHSDYEASYFCGVSFALRKSLVKKIGLFDEEFFIYCEEIDYSWRAMEAGYRILWTVDVPVVHRRLPYKRIPGKRAYFYARNRIWISLLHLPIRYILSNVFLWWGFLFWESAKNRALNDLFRGIKDCISGLPEMVRRRKVISKNTLRKIRRLSGRNIY